MPVCQNIHWATSYFLCGSWGQNFPVFSATYIMMAPDSKMEIGAPPPIGSLSTMAGMRLLGAIFRNSGENWSPRPMFTGFIV